MNTTTMRDSKPSKKARPGALPQVTTRRLRIEFTDEVAESVAVAGTFNDWRPEVTPMIALGDGRWVKDLTLPPGTYEYRLVVDGYKWVPDPEARETVPGPFGGVNSVLRVPANASPND